MLIRIATGSLLSLIITAISLAFFAPVQTEHSRVILLVAALAASCLGLFLVLFSRWAESREITSIRNELESLRKAFDRKVYWQLVSYRAEFREVGAETDGSNKKHCDLTFEELTYKVIVLTGRLRSSAAEMRAEIAEKLQSRIVA